MLPLCRRIVPGLGVAVLTLGLGCQKVPLLAPTGSTITLTASTTALSANATTPVIAQVLEAAGTPPHQGTHISFITTLGRLEPAEAETDVNGRVVTTFVAGGANGTATISALSGGATTGTTGSLKIFVGTAAVGRVAVNAAPATIAAGSSSSITALVIDINGNALIGTPVSFTTTAGTLSSTLALTDNNGVAASVLTTTTQATVTASVGAQAPAQSGSSGSGSSGSGSSGSGSSGTTTPNATGTASGSVTVNVSVAPSITIKPPASIQKGLAAQFTFTVTVPQTNGAPVKESTVDWGDGQVQSLGSFTGDQVASHVYNSTGTFLVTAKVTDLTGSGNSSSTPVTVAATPGIGVVVSANPASTTVGTSITFTITITAPTGVSIASASIDYGDGQVDQLGAASGTITKTHVYSTPGTRNVVVTVTDTTGHTNVGSTAVQIS